MLRFPHFWDWLRSVPPKFSGKIDGAQQLVGVSKSVPQPYRQGKGDIMGHNLHKSTPKSELIVPYMRRPRDAWISLTGATFLICLTVVAITAITRHKDEHEISFICMMIGGAFLALAVIQILQFFDIRNRPRFLVVPTDPISNEYCDWYTTNKTVDALKATLNLDKIGYLVLSIDQRPMSSYALTPERSEGGSPTQRGHYWRTTTLRAHIEIIGKNVFVRFFEGARTDSVRVPLAVAIQHWQVLSKLEFQVYDFITRLLNTAEKFAELEAERTQLRIDIDQQARTLTRENLTLQEEVRALKKEVCDLRASRDALAATYPYVVLIVLALIDVLKDRNVLTPKRGGKIGLIRRAAATRLLKLLQIVPFEDPTQSLDLEELMKRLSYDASCSDNVPDLLPELRDAFLEIHLAPAEGRRSSKPEPSQEALVPSGAA